MSKETKATRELSYYELYLLDYLRQHKFTQQHDRDFIRTRAQRPTSRNDGTGIHQTRRRNWRCRHSPRDCTILSTTSF